MSEPPVFDAGFVATLDDLFAWRRDVRHFRTDPLPDGAIAELVAIAALAPSVGNAQPWRFVDATARRRALADHVDAENARAAGRYEGAQADAYRALKLHGLGEAPEILAVFSDESPAAGHGLGIATMPEMLRYSTVMAVHTLWLAARARGIGLGWVSILDPATVSRLLEAEPGWTLIALLCIGYPAVASDVPELEERGWQARHETPLPLAGGVGG